MKGLHGIKEKYFWSLTFPELLFTLDPTTQQAVNLSVFIRGKQD